MLGIKLKQQIVIDAVNDPDIQTIVLIGSVGTGKTDVAALIGITIAYECKKTYWPVFRQNLSTAKKSTIPSYVNMLDMCGFVEGKHYKFNRQDSEIKFLHNKSVIGFVEADITRDRQGRKIKGINASGNHIDEADELHPTIFTMANARRGRRNQNGQPSISIITMNPNDTFLREKYYNHWHKPEEYGPLPKGVVVIEFTLEDSWQQEQDIDSMMTNPPAWRERYLFNNWDFQDDDMSLFKYRYFSKNIVSLLDGNAPRFAGYDVAREGNDRSVQAMWYGRTLVDIQIFKEKDQKIMTDEQGMKLIKYMTENSILPENQAVDGVGVGVGVIDHMNSKGITVKTFKSGYKAPKEEYADLRSQVIWEFSQGLEKGTIKIYEGCPYRNELIMEAMAHLHTIDGKKLSVEPKDKVKERTGTLSPDILDAVVMGLYPQLQIDPKTDSRRIIF